MTTRPFASAFLRPLMRGAMRISQLIPMRWHKAVLHRLPAPLQVKIQRFYRKTLSSTSEMPVSANHAIIAQTGMIQVPNLSASYKPGMNVIGYARGGFGLGVMARSSVRALQAAQIPVDVINCDRGSEHNVQDNSVDAFITDEARHKANLFCFNTDGLFTYANHYDHTLFTGRYNIHYLAWELAHFPPFWMPAMNLVQEIWTFSSFIQQSIAKSSTVPVINMGMEITCQPPRMHHRAHYGLPDDRFIFLFSFDVSSVVMRKNPMAVIEAFRKAFPVSSPAQVALVLKISSTAGNAQHKRHMEKITALIQEDPRIHLIHKVLTHHEMADLLNNCDAYVSLHRAEGFGCGMAEAMLLGKPVVATNYSGNLDFTKPDNSCLVNYQLIPLNPGDYLFEEGQVWADPDSEHAAYYMRRLYDDRNFGKEIGQKAQSFIKEHYSAHAVGARFRERLSLLGLLK